VGILVDILGGGLIDKRQVLLLGSVICFGESRLLCFLELFKALLELGDV
jgi:hypothetical protein